jgi:hypothetical protein
VKLPNAKNAVVDIAKLRDYCLSLDHPRGKHKARVFAAALGLTVDHAEELQIALLEAADTEDAAATDQDEFGQRYVIEFTMKGQVGTGRILASWIVRSDEDFPRLTSCYVV